MKLSTTITLVLLSLNLSAQSIKYFGLDTNYNHDPKDILFTSDNGFLINGDCNYAGSFIESSYSKQYYVKTNITGDTLWTKYFNQDSYGFGNTSSMQSSNGNLHTYGNVGAGYVCNGIGMSWPYSDFSLRTLTSTGNLVSSYSSDSECYDRVIDGKKKQIGMYLLYEMEGTGFNSTYYRIVDFWDNFIGLVSQTPLPYTYLTNIEKAPSGYWLTSSDKLYKVTDNNVELWNTNLSSSFPLADFCRVDYDKLLFAHSSSDNGYGDSLRLIKTDSSGVQIWNKKFYIRAKSVFQHSSGNYVITGRNNNRASVLVVNSVGDSLWGKNYTLNMSSYGIKTIEYNNGKLATLAYSGGFGIAGKYALILDTIDVLPNSGLLENQIESIVSISPNPTNSEITISSPETISNLSIYQLDGKLVYEKNELFQSKTLNISHFSTGTYLLKAHTNAGTISKKIIKL